MPTERRLTEVLGSVHDGSPDIVICVDEDLGIVYANQTASARAGVSARDLIGVACHEALMACAVPCGVCRADEVFESGATLSYTGGADTHHPGAEIEHTWQPIRDDTGRVLCVLERIRVEVAPGCLTGPAGPSAAATVASPPRACGHLDTTPAILLTLDKEGKVTLINKTGCELLGVPEHDVVGHPLVEEFIEPSERAQCVEHFETLLTSAPRDVEPCENTIVRPDGSRRTIEWHASALHDEDGAVTGVVASGVDISRRKAAQSELVFHSWVLDQANDSVIVHTPEGVPVYANAKAAAMCAMSREALLGLEPFGWLAEGHRALPDAVQESLEVTGAAIYETLYRTADGHTTPVEVHATAMDADGRGLIAAAGRDISERKRTEHMMTRLAFYDSLTGLANRALFLDRLRHAAATKARANERLAVAFIDLDHFKAVNDTFGHRTGDAVLVEVAKRLSSVLRESDTLARLGGDEFTVLLEGVQSERDAELVASKLLEAIERPLRVAGNEIRLTGSIGIAIGAPSEGDDSATLLTRADTAMYRAKQSGRATFCLHEPAYSEDACERLTLSRDLHHALELGEFDVHFQPIVRVEDGRLRGAEAFVRWHHPSLGPIPPATFLPIAEESGLIGIIGDWVLKTAVARFATWRPRGLPHDARLTVNLSARQLSAHGLVDRIDALVREHDLSGDVLEFEITESTVMHETGVARETLAALRDLGVRTSIDDFGSGYSSLEQLLALGIDTIKIDQRFVRGLGRNVQSTAICRAVISMAEQLGLTVVAEGVETRVQAACLRAERCHEMQGYLVSPPLPASAAETLLTRDTIAHWKGHAHGASRIAPV
ncbi:MAG: EAL domain-containing protein [Clostridiales bacterium]|nr:EAL domain-containing protein [Clostridiales bacterium]